MQELTKEQLAELRETPFSLDFAQVRMMRSAFEMLLDAAESRLAMLEALSVERAEEIAFLLPLSMTDEEKDLRAYALAARQKGAGE